MKIIFIFSCSGIFRDVPECSGMFRVLGFIDGRRSTCQKTSAVSDQTDTSLLRTARDETNNPANNLENCPCLPLLLDLQNKVKLIKANSSWQILPNLHDF